MYWEGIDIDAYFSSLVSHSTRRVAPKKQTRRVSTAPSDAESASDASTGLAEDDSESSETDFSDSDGDRDYGSKRAKAKVCNFPSALDLSSDSHSS